ncbi:MAG: methyltransferase domain-containing protein [Dorea sp.]|nr:methyltransferase domain-containing protein [Dorea sp.]
MGSLYYNNSKFIYEGQGGESQILLDCGCYLANKSRVPMHRLPGMEYLTIPDLLLGLLEKEKGHGEDLEFSAALLDILLASRLIKTSSPVNVLEYGSANGSLSFHLAEVLGSFHEDSVLVCAYDTIEPEWMERMAQIQHLPKLSYFAGDFGQLKLSKKYFDIVVINGIVNYLQPEEVINDALRLVTKDGILICYSEEAPLLESTFKLYFEQREEYEITPCRKVLLAKAKDKCWQNASEQNLYSRVQEDLEKAKTLLLQKQPSKKELSETSECLKKDIQSAVAAGKTDLKIRLIECRQEVLRI